MARRSQRQPEQTAMLDFWRKARPTTPLEPPVEPPAEPAERPATDALVPRSRNRHYPKVIMTLVLGLDRATLAPLVREMAAEGGGNGAAPASPTRPLEPLLVTDCTELALFRDQGLLFEYLPSPALQARHAPDLPWDVYTARRLERLRNKWAPVRIVAIGAVARQILACQLASPFADPEFVTLVGESAVPRNDQLVT